MWTGSYSRVPVFREKGRASNSKKMLKRFDRYVSRGADDDKNDDDLLEDIYMPGE